MRLRLLAAIACAVAALAALATTVAGQGDGPASVRATLHDATGAAVGHVTFRSVPTYGTVDVRAHLNGLKPGFHGFHVHAVGACERPTFESAEGHLKKGDQDHGEHAGDLPVLLVKGNGTATLRVTTDRFTLADLRDGDGSAVMVHSDADNYANIPPRYRAAGPDAETLDTGDAGDRVACGRIAPAGG